MRKRIDRVRALQLGVAAALLGALILGSLVVVVWHAQTTASASANGKPTGSGTPVPGAPQTPVTYKTGHGVSLLTLNGVTYASYNNDNPGPDTGDALYAFRASNGKLLWRYETNHLILTYAADERAIYLVSGATSDTIYALRASDGTLLWQRHLETGGYGLVSMVLSVGALYASASVYGAHGSVVSALRASDGALLWQWTAQVGLEEPITTFDGAIYIEPVELARFGKYTLHALRASDGKLLWSYPLGDIPSAPVSVGGVIYLYSDNTHLDAIQSATGKRLWRFTYETGQSFSGGSAPTVANGVIYAPSVNDTIYALRASDGALIWRAHSNSPANGGVYQLVVGDGAVYGAKGGGGVFALRASDGAALWHQQSYPPVMALTEAQGRVNVATGINTVYTLRASDGKLLWQQSVGMLSAVGNSAIVGDGVVYIGLDQGVVQALRASDGGTQWRYAIPPQVVLSAPVYVAAVTFDASVSYGDALRTVTDLGLQSGRACVDPQGFAWKSVGEDAYGGGSWYSSLFVRSTSLAPRDWLKLLSKAPGVTQVDPHPSYKCLQSLYTPPGPGNPAYLPPDETGTTVRISFSAQTSYDAALALVTNLGFLLGNPCYERLPQGANVQWMPMGQETEYASTHALLVVTTDLNSTAWQQQAQRSAGVTGVQVAPSAKCGKQ